VVEPDCQQVHLARAQDILYSLEDIFSDSTLLMSPRVWIPGLLSCLEYLVGALPLENVPLETLLPQVTGSERQAFPSSCSHTLLQIYCPSSGGLGYWFDASQMP